jgi:hypothetical protein
MIGRDVLQDLLNHRKEVVIENLSIDNELHIVPGHLLRQPLRHKLGDLFQTETQLLPTFLYLSDFSLFLSLVDEHVGGLA